MTKELREQISHMAAHGTLLHAIFHDFGKQFGEDAEQAVTALVELHNDGTIDLFKLITPETLEPYKGPVFFQGQQVFCALIPRLEATAATLMTVVDALVTAGGADWAPHQPIEEFEKWCSLKPSRPAELLSLIDQKVPSSNKFLATAIKCGIEVDRDHFMSRAYDFLASSDEVEKLGAIEVLGQNPPLNRTEWCRQINAFAALLDSSPSDSVGAYVLTAIVRKLKHATAEQTQRLAELGIAAVKPRGDLLLHAAARAIAFYSEHVPINLLDSLLEALCSVNASHKGTIDILDNALAKLVEHGQATRARICAENILRRDVDPVDLEHFISLRHKLFKNEENALEDWVVTWLLDGDIVLCRSMNDAFFGAGADTHTFQIDFTRFELRASDYPYLARKAIGTFFIKPILMTSILVSLLRSAPEQAAQNITDLLVDPVLINYSGVVSEFLEPVAANRLDPAAPHTQRALYARIEYLQGLSSIETVPELHPSERQRQMERQRYADSMAEVFRQTKRQSILESIATKKVLLHGTRLVSWVYDDSKPARRIETELATIGHSFELPRVDVVDPEGLRRMINIFRIETRPA